MKIKAIITGATGMVGEGVLLECLENPNVEQVLVINRKPGGRSHPKLKEVILKDFFKPEEVREQLSGYNACFFCLGISSVGISKEEYKRTTYDLTIKFANMLKSLNPDLTFCYITGAGTDSTENGSLAWARVKGATENELMRIFKNAYMFRPGFMKASADQKNIKSYYKFFSWMYPIGRKLFPGGFCRLDEVGRAMIHAALKGSPKKVLEVRDIVALGNL